MRIAAIQLRVDDDEPAASRIERALALVRAQAGADLVVLPELWIPGAFAYGKFEASATELPGPVLTRIGEVAREIGAPVLAGTVIERHGDHRYNTAVLVSAAGEIAHTYRKVHLFGFDHGEARMLSAGTEVTAYELPGPVMFGTSTCYDLRFPELYRLLVDQGVELLVVPTGWPAARLEHWLLLTRARAIENQVFFVGCNQVGNQEGVELAGHSIAIDPWGKVLAEAGTGEEVITVEIDLAMVAKTRAEFPVLRDRKLGLPPRHGGQQGDIG